MTDLGLVQALIDQFGSAPDPEDVAAAVAAYLEEHPEATCPIDDTAGEGDTGKVWSADKIKEETDGLKEAIAYKTPEMFGAVGDGVTDDSEAVQDAVNAGYAVRFGDNKTYYLASTVTVDHDCHLFGGKNTVIKTKTPTGGTAPNGIVVTGTLKKTTVLTTDYTSIGATDNSGNQFTFADMTGIAIGDILVIEATDQFFSYARQYYYLGATLLISDIYDGHIYTSNSMPWDIENTENVSVKVYSAPTAIIDCINFISDLDSRGNYRYLLSLDHVKNSVIRDCNLTQMDNGISLSNCVNTLIDGVTVSKSKYDNTLPSDGYGIMIRSCSETIVQRVLAICSQGCVDLGGTTPNINTYVRNCNLTSECRAIGIDMHENSFNIVVEDCTLSGLSLYGTATVNRCRFIINNRSYKNGTTGIMYRGGHDPKYSELYVMNCVFDGQLNVMLDRPIPQTPIRAFENIIGNVEIHDCTGGRLVYRPSTSEEVTSNTVKRLVIDGWRNCYNIYFNGSSLEELSVINSTFSTETKWLVTYPGSAFDGIKHIVYKSDNPQEGMLIVNTDQADTYCLPEDTEITFASSDASAHYVVCGNNIQSNDVTDYGIGSVSGAVGSELVRSASISTGSALSVNENGELVFTQPNNTNNYSIYPMYLMKARKGTKFKMSCKLKNTGDTSGASFRIYAAVVDADTGLITYRNNGESAQATTDGAVVTLTRDITKDSLIICYLYCYSAVANSETTFSEFVAMAKSATIDPALVFEPYIGTSRVGDGALRSVAGLNNIAADGTADVSIKFVADFTRKPIGALPNAVGVNF